MNKLYWKGLSNQIKGHPAYKPVTYSLFILLAVWLIAYSKSFHHNAQTYWQLTINQKDLLAALVINNSQMHSTNTQMVDGQSLVSAVANSAKPLGIAIASMQPNSTQLTLTVESSDFSSIVSWLAHLQQVQHLNINEITLNRTKVGEAGLQMTLEKAAR